MTTVHISKITTVAETVDDINSTREFIIRKRNFGLWIIKNFVEQMYNIYSFILSGTKS